MVGAGVAQGQRVAVFLFGHGSGLGAAGDEFGPPQGEDDPVIGAIGRKAVLLDEQFELVGAEVEALADQRRVLQVAVVGRIGVFRPAHFVPVRRIGLKDSGPFRRLAPEAPVAVAGSKVGLGNGHAFQRRHLDRRRSVRDDLKSSLEQQRFLVAADEQAAHRLLVLPQPFHVADQLRDRLVVLALDGIADLAHFLARTGGAVAHAGAAIVDEREQRAESVALQFLCIRKGAERLAAVFGNGGAIEHLQRHVPWHSDRTERGQHLSGGLAAFAAGLDHQVDIGQRQQSGPVPSDLRFCIVAEVVADADGDAAVAFRPFRAEQAGLVMGAAGDFLLDDEPA